MSRFERRGAQQQPTPALVTGSTATRHALVQGRTTGHLKLRGKGLTALPPEACDIGNVALPEGSAWWETRETLESLDASQNEITSLPDAIASLDQLRELDVSRNRLTALPEAACWAPLEALVSLAVGHNQLGALPVGLGADNLPPLVRLAANDNQLTTLPPTLGGLRDLVELDVSRNRLGRLPRGLSGLVSLKKLDMHANGLTELPDDLLASPPPLTDLDISENQLHVLSLCLPSALKLNLAKNRLTALGLEGCGSVQEVVAPYNALSTLPTGLPALPALATIDLGSNKLVRIDELAACASLTRVDISNNDLREVPPRMGLLSLNRLGLLGNPLRTMPSAVLNGPTPKLLAHLRGKIVDAAPQWEGDVRGSMHAPPRAECSLLSIGAQHEDGRRLASVGAENVQPARVNMGPAEGGYDHTSFGYGSQERGGYIGGGGGGGGGRGGFDALYNRPPPGARSNGPAGGSAPIVFGGGGGGFGSAPAEGQRQASQAGGNQAAANQASANQAAANQASANQASAGQALGVHLMKEGSELAMSGLNLSALPAAGYPESLTRVDASANKLTELPQALTDLPSLMALDVSRNLLSDLPPDLGSYKRLTSVRASHNKIAGPLHFVRGVLPYLAELHLDRNGLTELPAALWGCPSLKSVSLCANRLTLGATRMPADMGAFYEAADTYPGAEMAAVAPLEMLDLGENRLGAMPPVHLYSQLRELHVQQNGIRELPADQLRPLRQLQTLDVSMNDVSSLPPELALLPVLQNLNIIGNPIRSIPQSVQQRGATAVIDLLRKRLPDSALR